MDKIAYMKSVNFEFLRPGNELLANLAGLAEAVLHVDPGSALTRLRSFAEEMTKAIYKHETLPRVPQATFYELVKDPVFVDCVSKPLVYQLNFLRIQGNDTAHGGEGDVQQITVSKRDAEKCLLLEGDILLTEGGDPDKLGRGHVWRGEVEGCLHQNHIFSVRVNDQGRVRPGFLSAIISSPREILKKTS
ncbi:DUF4145 domain-containing protein [Pseudomonas shirazica]|uniref:DUF4145 domain-containing protein n=1 Tax=Pseudomonas shirazica TaxID=1940636 RepID=UPI0034D743FB